MVGKIVGWGVLAAVVYTLISFRGDIQRYLKMERM
jgi:hypothetical protein